MAGGIGDLILNIVANMQGFSTSVVKEGEKAGTQAAKGFGAKFKNSLSGAKGGLLAGLGLGAGVGAFQAFSMAGSAAVDVIFDSIDAASNLNEAMTKTDAVFGDSAEEIQDWAANAAEAFGQSKRSALEAAGTYGNLFQAFGIGRKEATEMSKTLVELAADLASFNNTSVDDALIALRSGLSGETEPLKRYGVAINDVRLKEEAMRLGLIKTTKGVLPVAIKSQAAYSLILKDTAMAQGDFARTSDGLANTQRILAAKLEDVEAQIGEKLVPVMLTLAGVLNDDVLPAVQNLINLMNLLSGDLPENEVELVNLTKSLLDLASAVPVVGTVFGAMAGAVEDDLDLIERKFTATERLMDHRSGEIQDSLGEVGPAATDMANEVDDAADDTSRSFSGMVDDLVSEVGRLIDDVYDPAIRAADYAALRAEIADNNRVISAKDSGKEEVKAAQDRKVRLDKELDEMRLDLLEHGELTVTATKNWLGELQKKYDSSTGAARADIGALMNRIRALSKLTAPGLDIDVRTRIYTPTSPGPHRAGGGPVVAGHAYRYRENSQDEVFIPAVSGRTMAAAEVGRAVMAGGGGMGGNTHITQNIAAPAAGVRPTDLVIAMQRIADIGVLPPTGIEDEVHG